MSNQTSSTLLQKQHNLREVGGIKSRNWRSGAVGLYSHRTPTVATFLCCGKYILAEHVW